jgi:ATP-dependent DNA ligase I
VQFTHLVSCSERIASNSARNDKISVLAAFLTQLDPHAELRIGVAMLCGRVRQGRTGVGPNPVWTLRETPPAGNPTLTLDDVDHVFEDIAAISGPGSVRGRVERLRTLFERATDNEQKFVTRLVYGELQQGAMEGVMVEAIARAATVPSTTVRRAFMARGDLLEVAVTAMTQGSAGLARFGVQVLRPVQPMLAQPAPDIGSALTDTDRALAEYKLDGARIQVHKAGDVIRVYSRQLRDVTPTVPEIVDLARGWPARELIVDGEVIAFRTDGLPHPFQVTMRRFGRKLDVAEARASLPLSACLFDLLYLDGASLVDEPLERRRALLAEQTPDQLIPQRRIDSREDADAFLEAALAAGHEGVMVKSLTSSYEAGSRGSAWYKVKPSHTLDLVILAADWGHGRRTGWLSNLHLGARDPSNGGFVMLGKTFKGLTDDMLRWQTEQLLAREIGRDRYTVHVKPDLVVEVAFNEVQQSPRYPAGLALRFARVKRHRTDKGPGDADVIDTIRAIHRDGLRRRRTLGGGRPTA